MLLGSAPMPGIVHITLALAAFAIVLCVFSEDDGAKATMTLIGSVLFLQFLVKVDVFHYMKGNPFYFLTYAGIYVLAGLIWSVLKWWRYVAKIRREYDAARVRFCELHRLDPAAPLPLRFKALWQENSERDFGEPPQVTEHRGDIIRWMTYWPFSLLWTILNDPVRRLFEFLYNLVGAKMQAISDQLFKGTKSDYLTREEREEFERKKRE